jgi:hypothetical protein
VLKTEDIVIGVPDDNDFARSVVLSQHSSREASFAEKAGMARPWEGSASGFPAIPSGNRAYDSAAGSWAAAEPLHTLPPQFRNPSAGCRRHIRTQIATPRSPVAISPCVDLRFASSTRTSSPLTAVC